jgi:hypothetical protein
MVENIFLQEKSGKGYRDPYTESDSKIGFGKAGA